MKTRNKKMAASCTVSVDMKEETTDFNGCWILTESQEFIRRTFAFLPAKTLAGICARVCKAWHAEVKRVLNLREDVGWATFGRLQAEEETEVACQDSLGLFGVNLNASLNTIGSVPHLAIMFTECQSLEDFQGSSDGFLDLDSDDTGFSCSAGRRIRKPLKLLHSRLPVESSVICVHTDGTMGCQPDLSPAGESEGDLGVGCILLPKMEGVTVSYELHNRDALATTDIKAYIGSRRMLADTRCILVIYDDTHYGTSSYFRHLQRHFYDEFGTTPVISGGIARRVLVEPKSRDSCPRVVNPATGVHNFSSLLTITFSGPRVRAASIVLDRRVGTRQKVREKMLELKKVGLSEKRSLAFIFSCVGRGYRFYQEEDVESSAFHEIFPNTPLMGFFGGGEYGCDNLTCGKVVRDDEADHTAKAFGKKGQKKMPNLELSLTCVLCLLSFG